MTFSNRSRLPLARSMAAASLATVALASTVMAAGGTAIGPSTSTAPYLLPSAPGVITKSILTVGDNIDGYRLAGIPDGLGVMQGKHDTFTLLVNHEIGSGLGVTRAHGGIGAFVSQWSIDEDNLKVRSGKDLIRDLYVWNGSGYELATGSARNLNRLCSADLPALSAFYDARTHTGFNGRIFMNGEEAGNEGRAFANIATGAQAGATYELPALGNLSFENVVASPATGRKTVVIGLDDTTPGQVYVYVGEKQKSGSPIERAGLTGGSLLGVKVDGVADEDRTTGLGADVKDFSLYGFGDVSGMTGAALQTASEANGVTEFLRPEDGAWDPRHPNDFYFVTTDRFENVAQVGNSRLWRLRFDDVKNPALGGTIEMLLDGTEGQQMMDNITVDAIGKHVLIQEDPGNQTYFGRVWSYDIQHDALTEIAAHDPALFSGSGNEDEESSGIIDASDILGPGWFLATVQWHKSAGDPELVEKGQLLAIYSPASDWRRDGDDGNDDQDGADRGDDSDR